MSLPPCWLNVTSRSYFEDASPRQSPDIYIVAFHSVNRVCASANIFSLPACLWAPKCHSPAFQFVLQAASLGGRPDSERQGPGCRRPPPPTAADLDGKEAVGFTAGVLGLEKKERERRIFLKLPRTCKRTLNVSTYVVFGHERNCRFCMIHRSSC